MTKTAVAERKLFSCKEAAGRTGIPLGTILGACLDQKLPYVKDGSTGDGNKPIWMVSESDLMAYAEQWKPRTPVRAWTAADEAALIELYEKCPLDQLAIYLGRSYSAVAVKLSTMRRRGLMECKPKVSTNPFHMPRGSVLLAKSCSRCGKIRDGRMFNKNSRTDRYLADCAICRRDGKRGKHGNKPLYQQMSLAQATKHYDRYTSSELELISDAAKPVLVVAMQLGRTYNAISGKRAKLGVAPRGNREVIDRHWVIKFPAADTVLREYYHELGQPVPEELWDWNET